MASGKIHDQITHYTSGITLAVAPLVLQDWRGFIVGIGVEFGGLMFGPDLDLPSRQVNRWGFLKFIWKPYQNLIPHHRSFFSHGPIMGTVLRVGYVLFLISAGMLVWAIACNDLEVFARFNNLLRIYKYEIYLALLGVEIGAISHIVADWGPSDWPRVLHNWSVRRGFSKDRLQPKNPPKKKEVTVAIANPIQTANQKIAAAQTLLAQVMAANQQAVLNQRLVSAQQQLVDAQQQLNDLDAALRAAGIDLSQLNS